MKLDQVTSRNKIRKFLVSPAFIERPNGGLKIKPDGFASFKAQVRYITIRKEFSMLVYAVLICLGLLTYLGGDWYLSQFSAEELSKMGVQKR